MSATSTEQTLCYLNGAYGPLAEAKVSVLDRGFIFGDGVYEVVPVYGRRLFRFDEHMARLDRSLARIRIANPHLRDEWLQRARKLVAALEMLCKLHCDHLKPAGPASFEPPADPRMKPGAPGWWRAII